MESERHDVRQSVRGEFASAIESLSQERGNLLNELSDLRLKLAELKSEKEAEEKERKREMEMEIEKIHVK